MKKVRFALLAAALALLSATPSFTIVEPAKYWKITCPDGSQHVILGTYAEAVEFASIVC